MKKKVLENIVKWIFLLCGIAAVGFVLCICLYLVISGVPAIREIGLWNFLFGETWNAPTNEFGILPFILTSIYGTAGALLLGVPARPFHGGVSRQGRPAAHCRRGAQLRGAARGHPLGRVRSRWA